jgi:signal-transduction protein with cAMP-binding, CBS, and nucleotidyltransferase domain
MTLEQYCTDKRLLIQSSNATAYEAARALTNQHVGAVIVQEAGQIVGIVTDRDLTERVVAGSR